MLSTQLESHPFLQRPQNTFLILTSAHSELACFKWHKHGLQRDGTLCLPGASRGVWGGLIFFSLIMTLPIGKAVDSQTGAGLAVDLWVSRTEASFSIKRKVFFFFFNVYVIQE